jgi:hypothetical protein
MVGVTIVSDLLMQSRATDTSSNYCKSKKMSRKNKTDHRVPSFLTGLRFQTIFNVNSETAIMKLQVKFL